MHVSEGLGFSSLVLVVVCLVFPVIAHVIRRKWRRSVARTDEIKRLLVLAAEEAARAEMEATVGYSSVVSVTRSSYQCAVCYSPTTTRCARCKSVRYCSGKCQIIHWRQGHKEECRPPSTIYHPNDDGRSFVDIAKGKGQHDTTDESYEKESIGTSCIEHVMATPGHVLRVPTAKDDNIVIACIADSTEEFSASESASDTFSGFSASPSAGELSSDGFASESIISSEEPDAQISYDIGVGILDHAFDKIDGTNSLSPKSASLVDSASDFNKSSKVNQSKQCSHDGESRGVSTKSPDHISEISVVKPGKVSSGFWGRTLECATCRSDALDDSPLSNSIAAGNINCSDDVSFQQPKRTGNNVTSSHAQEPELKGSIDDSHSGALKTNKPIGGALAENTHASVQKSRNSLSSGMSNQADNYSTTKSNVTKSSEPKSSLSSTSVAYPSSEAGRGAVSTDLNVSSSQSSYSGWSNLVNSSVSTSHLRHSSLAADASCQRHPLNSDASGLSVPSLKTEKVTNAESTSVTSTQMASHSAANSISGLKSSVRKVVEHFKGPKKYCDKGLFPYDLFVRLYTSNKVAMQPCGLINCGNSCYANVVLQCLAFTPPLAAYFFQGLHSKACVNKEWCLNCEFEGLILKANEGKSSLSPIGIISQLQNIGRLLGRGREEDAHEFLRYAIDTMQSAFLKEAEVKAGSVEEETTLIGLTFGGYLRSKIKCTKCHYKSERRERMMDLTVEIEGDIEKLEDALRRFTSTEILDGDNKYLCSRCKSYEKAKKKLTILEAPNVLTITLKRFQSGKFGKLNKSIQFQEILDLAPYMSGTSDKSPIYRLYGVVVHLDIMNAAFSGHYVCYVKNVQNKWFKVDDSLVMPVEHDKVLSRGAYMLLYARCVPRDPKLIRNHIIFPDPKNNGCPTVLKSSILNSRRLTCSSVVQLQPNPISPNNTSNVESFYLRFHRLQRVFEEDSSSDTYSFTSSNSDEGSCSTDSSRESTSTEDFSDYIFGAWNSPWRNTSEADASSFSPSYVRHSSSNFQTNYVDSTMEDDDTWDRPRDQFFHTDANKHYGKAVNGSCRKSDKENILRDGLILAEVKQLH